MAVRGSASVAYLGTGTTSPMKNRWLPGILVRIRDEFILLDCGEGVQYRILAAGLKVNKLSAILISHLHGDHFYGLPGLLESLNNWGRAKPLTIVGPHDLSAFLELLKLRSKLGYEVYFVSAYDNLVVRRNGYTITTVAVDHGVEAYGYVITEDPLPGEFNADKARELGIPPGPYRSTLVRGEPVLLPDGRTIHPGDVLGPSREGLKIVYSGDTAPCENLTQAARGADLLIHESTFLSSHELEAAASFHSTSLDAARVALEAEVKLLSITHISSRYREEDLDRLLSEARSTFRRSFLARDLLRLELRRVSVDGLLAFFDQIQL